MIGAETGQADIGSDLIALKMSEIILAQALRQFLAGEGAAAAGLAGFTDPKLPHTLSAMRRNPDQQWTAADLARTGFALR